MTYTKYVCKGVNYLVNLLNIIDNSAECGKIDKENFGLSIVKESTCIIDKARRWDILLFKAVLKIREKSVTLNNVVKVSKDLNLF